jgi:hypothetical protein
MKLIAGNSNRPLAEALSSALAMPLTRANIRRFSDMEIFVEILENVRGESVKVPHWVRGEESAEMLTPRLERLPVLGLGGTIATPTGGVTAEILVVTNFTELTNRAAEARGRIVLFNAPFTRYGETVRYRWAGATEAAKAGVMAAVTRAAETATARKIISGHTPVGWSAIPSRSQIARGAFPRQ